jgi:AcrR family transcriptional regulator
MGDDEPRPGLRERKKEATEKAIHEAALRLFAERGFRETTVADIAAAANVAERTFFRYFRSKGDVVLHDAASVVPKLAAAIREQPPSEPPLAAVRGAILTLALRGDAQQLALLFSGPPVTWSEPLTPTPTRMRMVARFETSIAAALVERLGAAAKTDEDQVFAASVAARASVAALRSALIRFHELGGVETQPPRRFFELVMQAFGLLERGCVIER